MSDPSKTTDSSAEKEVPEEKNPRDAQGFKESPATQGLKTPPTIDVGEDSGEWTRGGGSDPDEAKR
jgi:hypothetical protein